MNVIYTLTLSSADRRFLHLKIFSAIAVESRRFQVGDKTPCIVCASSLYAEHFQQCLDSLHARYGIDKPYANRKGH